MALLDPAVHIQSRALYVRGGIDGQRGSNECPSLVNVLRKVLAKELGEGLARPTGGVTWPSMAAIEAWPSRNS